MKEIESFSPEVSLYFFCSTLSREVRALPKDHSTFPPFDGLIGNPSKGQHNNNLFVDLSN